MSEEEQKYALTILLDAQGRGSRKRLADMLGVTRQTVWRWEQRQAPIPEQVVPVILDQAKRLGFSFAKSDLDVGASGISMESVEEVMLDAGSEAQQAWGAKVPISTRLRADLLARADAISEIVSGIDSRTALIEKSLEEAILKIEAEPYTVQIPGVGVWYKPAGEPFPPLSEIRRLIKEKT